ncbi:MAG: nuclear transport factor 2 family protein [Minwuia sp.]|nr:nuclear transport factor 2 family protein [Minwuia sp.]
MASISPSSAESREADPLECYIDFFEGMTQADIARIPEVFTPDARFKDPFSDLRGHDRLARVFTAMLRDVRDYQLVVDDHVRKGDTGWLKWTMSGFVRPLGAERWVVTGVSIIRFDANGLVSEHVDYWDAAGQMYERLPLIGWILRRLRARFAAHSAAG